MEGVRVSVESSSTCEFADPIPVYRGGGEEESHVYIAQSVRASVMDSVQCISMPSHAKLLFFNL